MMVQPCASLTTAVAQSLEDCLCQNREQTRLLCSSSSLMLNHIVSRCLERIPQIRLFLNSAAPAVDVTERGNPCIEEKLKENNA